MLVNWLLFVNDYLVGTTVAAIISLLVVSGDNKVSTKDAFTMFENNTGWSNSKKGTKVVNIRAQTFAFQTAGLSYLRLPLQCGL